MTSIGILAGLVAATLLHAQTPQTVSIRVHLIDAFTHNPVANIQVEAIGTGKPVSAKSDSNGYCLIENLIPGNWTFRTRRANGYLTQVQAVDLPASEKMRDLELTVDRASVVSGRVLDHDHQPVKSAVVALYADGYRGGRVVMTSFQSARTDEKGEFQVPNLSPGRYYIRTELSPLPFTPVTENEAEQAARSAGTLTDIRTYYANSDSRDGASTIDLRANETREGLDIILLQQRTWCVILPIPDDTLSVYLAIAESEPSGFSNVARGGAGLVSYVKTCGLPPGDYRLTASTPGNLLQETRQFTITDRGLRLPTLDLTPSLAVTGTVRIAGSTATAPAAAKIFLAIEPKNRVATSGEQIGASIDLSGSFRLQNLVPQPYWLSVSKLPPGYYLEAIKAGGRDVYREPFIPGTELLEIVIGTNSPSVDGTVKDADFKTLPGAAVVLARMPLPATTTPTDVLTTKTDQQGNFRFDSFPPGDYTLFALTTASGSEQDPDFVRSKLSGGTAVKLSPNGIAHVQLTAHAP